MGKVYEAIDERMEKLLAAQKMFFVATAPMAEDGLINVSPKGLVGTFAVLGPRTVAYLDVTGSGIETVAHVKENGRIVLMFCTFEGPPRIVRLYGRGEILEPTHEEFPALLEVFPKHLGTRAIVRIHVSRIADSCGFGVPLMEYQGERSQITDYADRKGVQGLLEYQEKKNRRSLDGLPGLAGPLVGPSSEG